MRGCLLLPALPPSRCCRIAHFADKAVGVLRHQPVRQPEYSDAKFSKWVAATLLFVSRVLDGEKARDGERTVAATFLIWLGWECTPPSSSMARRHSQQ